MMLFEMSSIRKLIHSKLSRESHLADKLIDIHPWANMVRFARSGGEAAIAIRIARADIWKG